MVEGVLGLCIEYVPRIYRVSDADMLKLFYIFYELTKKQIPAVELHQHWKGKVS
jgi:hypothetical protein